MKKYRKRRHRKTILFLVLCMFGAAYALWTFKLADKSQLTEVFPFSEEPVKETVPFSEIEISESEVSDGYYYQQLTEDEQTLYLELYQGLRNSEDKIYVHSSDTDMLQKVVNFLLYDRAEIFWSAGAMQVTSYFDYSAVRPSYTYNGDEKEARQREIEAAAAEALSGVSPEAGEYEKVKYVFEYLVHTVDYSLDSPDNQNIYSALVERQSACAGYSRAAQYLLRQLGIECIYVTGRIANRGSHAWNIVNCGGQYYQMDVTFGDPVFQETESQEILPGSSINYDYLCCSDSEILKNHIPDTLVSFPQCQSTDLNYYRLNGMYYETYDPDQILEAMNQSIYGQESSFTCKFADAEVYNQACDDIINRLVPEAVQNLMAYYGLESAHYTYARDDVMTKLTVFWEY